MLHTMTITACDNRNPTNSENFNTLTGIERYLDLYLNSDQLVDSPLYLERLLFLLDTTREHYIHTANIIAEGVVEEEKKASQCRELCDVLEYLYQTLEHHLFRVGNMKIYEKIFSKDHPSKEDDHTTAASFISPSYLGFSFQQDQYKMTLQGQFVKETTLKANLSTAQHLISNKESLRNAHLHLASFYTSEGSYTNALIHLQRVKEYYSSTMVQLITVTLKLAELGLVMKQYSMVQQLYDPSATFTSIPRNSVSVGGSASLMDSEISTFRSHLNLARGISYMVEGYYKEAYESFLSVSIQDFPSSSTSTTITSNLNGNPSSYMVHSYDIVMYTGLMTLMVLSRKDIEKYMKKATFKSQFDSVMELKDALMYYSKADYGACLKSMKILHETR